MNNNCLVTKLKGSISDDSLAKIGEIKISGDNISGIFLITAVAGTTVRTTGNLTFSNRHGSGLTAWTFPNDGNEGFEMSGGSGSLFISHKYDISTLELRNFTPLFDIDELKYSTAMTIITARKTPKGNLESMKELRALTSLNLADPYVYGDIASISNLTSLESVVLNCHNVGGSILSFGKLTSLTSANLNASQITGSVEEFVGAQIANGRNSATIVWNFITCNLTFGGTLYKVADESTLSWTSSSHIVVNTPAKVFAKGATQQEIAAWEQAGKQVVVIS